VNFHRIVADRRRRRRRRRRRKISRRTRELDERFEIAHCIDYIVRLSVMNVSVRVDLETDDSRDSRRDFVEIDSNSNVSIYTYRSHRGQRLPPASEFTRCLRRDRVMVVELFLRETASSPFTPVDRLVSPLTISVRMHVYTCASISRRICMKRACISISFSFLSMTFLPLFVSRFFRIYIIIIVMALFPRIITSHSLHRVISCMAAHVTFIYSLRFD